MLKKVFTQIERAYEHNGDDACRDLLAGLCPGYRCHLCPLRWALSYIVPLVPVKLPRLVERLVLVEPPLRTAAPPAAPGRSALVAAAWACLLAGDRVALHMPRPRELLLDLLGAPPLCPRKLAAGQLDANEWMLVCQRASSLSEAGERLSLLAPRRPLLPGYRHLGHGGVFLRRAAAGNRRFVAVVPDRWHNLKRTGLSATIFQLGQGRPIQLLANRETFS